MPRSPAKRTNERTADSDAVFVHAAGRPMVRLSKRRVLVVAAAVVSAVVTSGFSLGFLLHAVGHG